MSQDTQRLLILVLLLCDDAVVSATIGLFLSNAAPCYYADKIYVKNKIIIFLSRCAYFRCQSNVECGSLGFRRLFLSQTETE